jgi:hypothetical protein
MKSEINKRRKHKELKRGTKKEELRGQKIRAKE